MWGIAEMVLNEVEPARQKAASGALVQFRGNYADQFAGRMATSEQNARTTADDLMTAATNIARAWADANHQQQLYDYYAAVQAKRQSQSFFDQAKDFLFGDSTNYGSPPAAPAVPQPPSFAPTWVPQAYVP